jgi:hypothetical protein
MSQNLWFVQAGDNLEIRLMREDMRIIVPGYFEDADVAAGGRKIGGRRMSQLVHAMATYSANNPAFNPTKVAQAACWRRCTLQKEHVVALAVAQKVSYPTDRRKLEFRSRRA